MRKIVSVAMSFLLVFAFLPTPAYAAGGAALGAATTDALSAQDAQGQDSGSEEPLAADSGSAVQVQEAFMTYQGDGFSLKLELCTFTPPEDPENPISGVQVVEINGGGNIVIPSQVTKDDVAYDVIGIDVSNTATWTYRSSTSITIPDSVRFVKGLLFGGQYTTSVVFSGDSKLTVLPDEMFKNSSIESVTLPGSLVAVSSSMFESSKLASITLPDSVRQINQRGFFATRELTDVELNEGLLVVGDEAFAHSVYGGFYRGDFPHVTEMQFPDSVHEIGQEAFRKVLTLEKVSFGTGQQTSQLDSIGDKAFFGTSLTRVDIPDSVTSIGSEAFSGKNQSAGSDGERDGDYVLAEVNLGSSQEASRLAKLGSKAFAYQPIEEVTLPNTLTSLGYDTSTYSIKDDELQGTLGAFSGCDKLTTVVWPKSSALTSVGGFDGCSLLTDESVNDILTHVSRIDDYAFFNCGVRDTVWRAPYRRTYFTTGLRDVVVPANVQSIGKGAFSKGSGDNYVLVDPSDPIYPVYTVLNPEVELGGWTADDPTTGPWPLKCGYTIRYSSKATADSSIAKYREAVEAYEAAQNVPEDKRTKFEAGYAVQGTVPAGASVRLHAGAAAYEPELDANNSFTMVVAPGTQVGAVVSLDGYADYNVSPKTGESAAGLDDDWAFEVQEGQMTPVSQLGILQVRTLGDYNQDSNVAVFDAATGKLVSQGSVLRARVYVVDDIPAGTYDVVAWQNNDYFSRVSSLGDFATMGFGSGDYAREQVTLAARETKEVALTVPELDVSKATGVLAKGEVAIPDLYVQPGVAFTATVRYNMVSGQSVDAVKVSIPKGMVPVAAASEARNYGIGGWSEAEHVLTISGLSDADAKTGRLSVVLRADEPGSYAVSASLVCGEVAAPIGSDTVEAPAIRLVAPDGTLQSREFTVHVYAKPDSNVQLEIGETTLSGVQCTTNALGHAKVKVRIPDEEISPSPYYLVTASVLAAAPGGENLSDSAIVQYFSTLGDMPYEPTVRDFSFESAGKQIDLVKDGDDLSGGFYVLGVHRDNFTRNMPFTAVIDSLQPLEGKATLYVGMVDNNVKTYDMSLSGTQELASGAKRYTFKGIVPLTSDDEFDTSEMPCRFDVVPGFPEGGTTTRPQLTASSMDTLNQGVDATAKALASKGEAVFKQVYDSLSDYQKKCLTGEYFFEDGYTSANPTVDYLKIKDYDYAFGVFNKSFSHETWDAGGAVWQSLTDQQRKDMQEAEDQIAAAFDALAVKLGNSKPMYAYKTLDDYLAGEYGYVSGSRSSDPAALARQGYTVVYDEEGRIDWHHYKSAYPESDTAGNITWHYEPADDQPSGPAWYAVKLDGSAVSGEVFAQGSGAQLGTQDAGALVQSGEPFALVADDAAAAQNLDGESCEAEDTVALQGWGDQAHRFIIDMAPPQDNATMDTVIGHSTDLALIAAGKIPENYAGFATRGGLSAYALYRSAKTAADGVADHSVIASEKTKRAAELERMEAMDKYYDTYNPGSLCQKALQAEISYMKDYLEDLDKSETVAYWSNNIGFVAGSLSAGAGLAAEYLAVKAAWANTNPETAAACKGASGICAAVSLGCTAVGVANTAATMGANELVNSELAAHAAQVKQWRFYRERECKKDDFGKLHYNKRPILDPSGFVYEGVEGNLLEGVTATVYEKAADGTWVQWNASSYDQESQQVTGDDGVFAWDVPAGTWKVVFAKEGYDDVAIVNGVLQAKAETEELVVPPQRLGIAVGLVSSVAPAVESVAVKDGAIVVTFSQYMRVAVAPAVKVNGAAVEGSWVESQLGTNHQGTREYLSKTLRVPLPAGAKPKDVVSLAAAGGESYAGKSLAGESAYSLTVPGELKYTVNFNANGGKAVASRQVVDGNAIGTLPTTTRSGYDFAGWYAGSTRVTSAYKPTADVTLTARWTVSRMTMLRVYNPYSGEHLYTYDTREYSYLGSIGWKQEKTAWIAPAYSSKPVYRVYNPFNGDHHYTTEASERNYLVSIGWKDEKVGWYSDTSKTKAVYRLFNPYLQAGSHHYTTSASERAYLISIGWKDEGIGWYALS